MPYRFLLVFCYGALSVTHSIAATFSGQMTGAEVDKIIQTIGQGSASKFLRSAEPYDDLFPGLKVGIEVNVIFSGDLETFGDGTGTVPGIILMPRLYIAKSLPWKFELMFNMYPKSFTGTVSSTGLMLKWNLVDERNKFFAAAVYGAYTSVSGFDDAYEGSSYEVGGVASKDYVKYRPYVGLGTLFARGNISSQYLKTGVSGSAWQSTLHAFLGVEIPTPAFDASVQLDFMNLAPRFSFFLGKKI